MRKMRLIHGVALSISFVPALATAADFLEEIIVSATKRDEAAQDLPIALTAVGGDQMRDLGITNAQDIDTLVPNFHYESGFGQSTPNIALRGVGNLSFFSSNISPVAVYSDSIYIGQSIAQGFALFDLERVEVLRGPQGSLFGRNSTGGLVNFISVKPVVGEDATGFIYQLIGEKNSLDTEAAISFPVSDTVAARLSLRRNSTDGFFKNVNPTSSSDSDAGEVEMYSGRFQLLWEPSDTFSGLFNVHYGNGNNDSVPRQFSFIDQSSLANAPDLDFSGTPTPGDIVDNCAGGADSGAFKGGCTDPYGLGLTSNNDPHKVQSSADNKEELDTLGVALTLHWDILDGNYTIISTTGWDSAKREYVGDDDGGPLVALDELYLDDGEYWSTELRLLSNNDGPFNWQTGIYYYEDNLNAQIHGNNRDTVDPFTNIYPAGTGLSQVYNQNTESVAVFGSFEHTFNEHWELRGGARYTYDRRDVEKFRTFITDAGVSAFLPFPTGTVPLPGTAPSSASQAAAADLTSVFGPLIAPVDIDESWEEWSGNIALSYIVDEHLFYVSAARGFKGGELNSGEFVNPLGVVIVDPEYVNSYEIGYKGTELADGKLQVNLSGFYSETIDKQILVDVPVGGGIFPVLSNAGEAETYGVELEVRFQPNEFWFFMLSGGYMNGEFTKLENAGRDLSGNNLPQTPEYTMSGLIHYSMPVADGELGIQLDGNYRSDVNFGIFEDPDLEIDGYGVWNARVSYTFMDEQMEVAAFVKNLTNEEYVNYPFDPNAAFFGSKVFAFGNPRWAGVSASYNF